MERDSCQICFNVYETERRAYIISPCGHSACKECILSIYQINSTCPFCKVDFNKPFEELHECFDTSLNIENEVRQQEDKDCKCNICKGIIVSAYVQQSKENIQYICKRCAISIFKENEYQFTRFNGSLSEMETFIEKYLNSNLNEPLASFMQTEQNEYEIINLIFKITLTYLNKDQAIKIPFLSLKNYLLAVERIYFHLFQSIPIQTKYSNNGYKQNWNKQNYYSQTESQRNSRYHNSQSGKRNQNKNFNSNKVNHNNSTKVSKKPIRYLVKREFAKQVTEFFKTNEIFDDYTAAVGESLILKNNGNNTFGSTLDKLKDPENYSESNLKNLAVQVNSLLSLKNCQFFKDNVDELLDGLEIYFEEYLRDYNYYFYNY